MLEEDPTYLGHRQRLKERFLREGLDHFDELYVLELLLFYCIPRKDTNELAHRLLEQFGSFAAVLDADYEVKAVQPVDMFPHTHHVENVVLLERRVVK